MCRTRDEGPYAVGNVRIDTKKANAAEAGVVRRVRRASIAISNKPIVRSKHPESEWLWRRTVFEPYTEDEEESA